MLIHRALRRWAGSAIDAIIDAKRYIGGFAFGSNTGKDSQVLDIKREPFEPTDPRDRDLGITRFYEYIIMGNSVYERVTWAANDPRAIHQKGYLRGSIPN